MTSNHQAAGSNPAGGALSDVLNYHTARATKGLPGSVEFDSLSQPCRELLFVDLASSNVQHCPFGVFDFRWVRRPPARVEVDEDDKCSPSSPLVAVGQRMVARQPPAQNRCFVDDVGIELLAAELGHRGVESRIRQFYAARCPHCLRGCAGNLLGEPQVLRQAVRYLVNGLSAREALCLAPTAAWLLR